MGAGLESIAHTVLVKIALLLCCFDRNSEPISVVVIVIDGIIITIKRQPKIVFVHQRRCTPISRKVTQTLQLHSPQGFETRFGLERRIGCNILFCLVQLMRWRVDLSLHVLSSLHETKCFAPAPAPANAKDLVSMSDYSTMS